MNQNERTQCGIKFAASLPKHARGKNVLPNHLHHLVAEILRYLIKHPDAKDSPDGIRRWWLSSQPCSPTDEDMEGALEFIVRNGWLEERSITPTRRVFAAKRGSMKSAAEYLQQHIGRFNEYQNQN